jgi:hypothetical protein
MRFAILAVGLLVLAACVQPAPSPMKNAANKSDLYRFIEPTDGAAYSQSDMYYYRANANPGAAGPSGEFRAK